MNSSRATKAFAYSLAFLLPLNMGCEKDAVSSEQPVPTTYAEFENVSYEGQLQRLAQLGELKAYAKTANAGAALDSARLAAMYRNAPNASFQGVYTKAIHPKTFAPFQDNFDKYFGRIAGLSALETPLSPMQAGLQTAQSGKSYLLADNGVEYLQVIEKGLMGACFFYQANGVYLSDQRMNADNDEVTPGEGTARQHFFDEAFGYFGVPKDFPADTDGVAFWGDYCNDRNPELGTNTIMEAFLKGRAALVNKDDAALGEAIEQISQQWSIVAASTAIHYLNLALEHEHDSAARAHDLTEAIAFAFALPLSQRAAQTQAEVDEIVRNLAGSSDYSAMNLWTVSNEAIVATLQQMAEVYGIAAQAPNL